VLDFYWIKFRRFTESTISFWEENSMVSRQTIGGTRKFGLKLAIGMLLLLLPIQAQAGVLGIGVTAKGGTTGVGADLTVPLVSNWLNLRAGYNFGSLRPSITYSGIKYKADVDFETVPILLDLHPFHGNFRITGGVFYNNNEMDLSSTVDASTVGLGAGAGTATLNAAVSWSNEFAPYLGIGWGNAADDNTLDLPIAIGFSLDVGAFYQGSPDVLLTDSSGLVSPADLAIEQQQLQDDLDGFKFYPVVTLGIHIRF
jgi:hypothetical protein